MVGYFGCNTSSSFSALNGYHPVEKNQSKRYWDCLNLTDKSTLRLFHRVLVAGKAAGNVRGC